jgi:hypothetical protein
MLETEGAMHWYTHGHGLAYVANIADGALLEAVRLLSAAAAAAPVVRLIGSGVAGDAIDVDAD